MVKRIEVTEYLEHPGRYDHLFEITTQQPLDRDWVEREIYDLGGCLMIGDLNLHQQETEQIEFHPFPEWVIKIYQPGKTPGKSFLLVPDLDRDFIRELSVVDYTSRNEIAQKRVRTLTTDEFYAVEYIDGLCIKVPENVPHYFLSVINDGEDVPFLEVFEPKIPLLEKVLKCPSNTEMLNLSFILRAY
mgnify:CR=1 FL=1